MRDLGTPVYGKSFFRNILEAFSDTTTILAVYHETKMIAAGIGSWYEYVGNPLGLVHKRLQNALS